MSNYNKICIESFPDALHNRLSDEINTEPIQWHKREHEWNKFGKQIKRWNVKLVN